MLKGRTIITLKNEKTGEIENFENENLVTNAINSTLNCNIEGLHYPVGGTGTTWDENILPIAPNSIGGVLLFSDPIEENVNTLYAPSSNPCVGYASNDVNDTAEIKRGSLNLNESKKLENGYKFVWDFATSQGNGPISCIALTHKFGGLSYFGDEYISDKRLFATKSIANSIPTERFELYANTVEINFEGNYFISMAVKEDGDINIRKYKKPLTKLGINDSCKELEEVLLDERDITPNVFIKDNNGYYYDFFDGENGYWYGFWNYSNSEGDGHIKWIKIDKSDFSFTEGEWEISNAKLYNISSRYALGGGYSRSIYSVLKNGYLYIRDYTSDGIYKINVESAADTIYIPFGFKSQFSTSNGLHLYVLADFICGSDFIISSTDEVIKTKNTTISYQRTPMFSHGVYLYAFGPYYHSGWGSSTKYMYKLLHLLMPYLATINNLSTPVMKTADKTMKITYFLEEQ